MTDRDLLDQLATADLDQLRLILQAGVQCQRNQPEMGRFTSVGQQPSAYEERLS
jgi:hypothetical protein